MSEDIPMRTLISKHFKESALHNKAKGTTVAEEKNGLMEATALTSELVAEGKLTYSKAKRAKVADEKSEVVEAAAFTSELAKDKSTYSKVAVAKSEEVADKRVEMAEKEARGV